MIKTIFVCDICKEEFSIGSTSIAKIVIKESGCRREIYLVQPELNSPGAHVCRSCVEALVKVTWKE